MTHIEQRRVIIHEGGVPGGAAAVLHADDHGNGAAGRGRYDQGWRAGKPAEDPEKLKKWGRISAKPSEYLIHMRRGSLRPTSGQGASCFKLPGDSVAVVPTTVQKLQFTADQVTLEKVGVEVTGLAVYRIVEPLIAFRMLNFSFPERAQEKLEALLVDMFAGAVRRLVANLSVEECLTRRKEGLASELIREIVPVVSGRGSTEDATDKGWGVLIDTIEIQDVRILSPAVFGNLQAHYRQEQERKAREASLLTERAVRQGEAEAQRAIELTKLSAEVELRTRRQETSEKARLEELASEARVSEAKLVSERAARERQITLDSEIELRKLAADVSLKQQRQATSEQGKLEELAAEARLKETRLAHEQQIAALTLRAEIEKTTLEAEAAAARHAAKMAASAHEIDLLRQRAAIAGARRLVAEAELSIAEIEARKARLTQELELDRARALREIENTVSPEIIRLTVAQQMPALAAAFQQRMGEVHITAVDGANPFGYIAAAVEGVMGLARAAGLEVPPARAQKAELTEESGPDSSRR
ncbi:SPFH domain-containing protein [Sorangium atrum]|uniref:SPFH domain-containing protein n=1 Tax=Sorangium atrum TaxID=2995308 RepID=A0ABT5C4Q9_9BACT|nr:SPFH domain-containing protein [Sorangium aterium]MDC0681407.1 SPFH domain-containing protein [Sorangium aterium]